MALYILCKIFRPLHLVELDLMAGRLTEWWLAGKMQVKFKNLKLLVIKIFDFLLYFTNIQNCFSSINLLNYMIFYELRI